MALVKPVLAQKARYFSRAYVSGPADEVMWALTITTVFGAMRTAARAIASAAAGKRGTCRLVPTGASR